MKDQSADKRSWIVGGALLLTVILLGVFAWLLTGTETRAGCGLGFPLLDRLSCLEPNAIGDTFAGAFAPVAFVWLVAAVLLQQRELTAQRQELRLTRKVSSEQVEEARKNVALIKEQTEMLKRQREVDEQRLADDHVGLLIEVACETAYGFRAMSIFIHMQEAFSVGNIKPSGDKAADLKKYIDQLAVVAANAKELHGENGPVELADPERVQQLADHLADIHHTSDRASPPVRAKVRQMRIRVGRLACATLLKHSDHGDRGEVMNAILDNDPN